MGTNKETTKPTLPIHVSRPRMISVDIEHEIESLRKASEEVCKSKESALDFLVHYGFLTKDGKLTDRYSG